MKVDGEEININLHKIQIKSLEKARRLAYALNIIEEECGIHEVAIRISESFVCPWIDLDKLNETEMEKLVSSMLKQIA